MYFHCNCGKWKMAHDSSTSIKPWLCDECKEVQRKRRFLPIRRGLSKPFSDYNPRPTRIETLRYVSFGRRIETARLR